MGRDRLIWAYRAVCACLLAVVVVVITWTWKRWQVGQVDPVSACIALVGLALALLAGRQATLAQRNTETDVDARLPSLANAVLAAETLQRTQLLAGQSRTIDVDFVLKRAPGHNALGAARE